MKTAFLMSSAAAAAWLGAGCVGEPADDREDAPALAASEQGLGPAPEDPEQGRHILGSVPDTLAGPNGHVRVKSLTLDGWEVSVMPAGAAGINGSNLTATKNGTTIRRDDVSFKYKVFEAVPGGLIQIWDLAPPPANSVAPSTRYILKYSFDGGQTWADYCTGGGGAIALQGGYDLARTHYYAGDRITFSCEDGVATKCDRWGYVAGNGGPTTASWQYHQACTGMANAAYCGDGVPYTRELTPIRLRDFSTDTGNPPPTDLTHPAELPGDPDTFYVEAGWDKLGHPVCLSKIRWRSLPPNPCPGTLPDPRFVRGTDSDSKPQPIFCDELSAMDLQGLGALIVNGSKMMDAPLQHWRNPTTGDDISTIRGFYIDRDGSSGPDADSTLPFKGYTDFLGNDGMLLRNLPGTLDPTKMQKLYLKTVGNDRFLTDVAPAIISPSSFEAYSFPVSTTVPGLAPLRRCTALDGDQNTIYGNVAGAAGCVDLKYALPAPPPWPGP